MNRAVDPAATQKSAVGSVYNRVDRLPSDVAGLDDDSSIEKRRESGLLSESIGS